MAAAATRLGHDELRQTKPEPVKEQSDDTSTTHYITVRAPRSVPL